MEPALKGGQNFGRLPLLRCPNNPLIIAAAIAREGFAQRVHQPFRIGKDRRFQKIGENLG
jgi:hypothetical protein